MRFLKSFIVCVSLIFVFSACKKDNDTIDTTPRFYFIGGGTGSFDNNLVLFSSPDTATYSIVISSTYYLSKEVTVTLGVGDNYRESYNNDHSTDYKAMPAAAYSFQTTSTSAVNTVYDTILVKFNKNLLLSEDYMLPITITSVSDYKIDSAASVIYLHTKNNQLSGIYTSTGLRILYNGDASGNDTSSADSFSTTKTSIPVMDSVPGIDYAEIDYADLGTNGWKYILSYENGDFTVKANDIIESSVQSFTVLYSSFDSATRDMYIKTSYKNLSGNERIVEESLSLQ